MFNALSYALKQYLPATATFKHFQVTHLFSRYSRYLFEYVNTNFSLSRPLFHYVCMLKWGKRDGGSETEIHTPPLSFLTSAASQLFHNSVQAASSSSPDRFEDDCAVRTFINKIHHRHAVDEHNTNTCMQRQTHSCTHLRHDDEWHTSTFPSTARYRGAAKRSRVPLAALS